MTFQHHHHHHHHDGDDDDAGYDRESYPACHIMQDMLMGAS